MVENSRRTDGEDHGAKCNSGDDPMHARELSPREPEQRDGQENSADPTPPQPRLRTRNTTVLLPDLRVHLLLVEARPEREEAAQDRRDVWETGDALAPAVMVLEREWDDGEEEEDDGPAKASQREKKKTTGSRTRRTKARVVEAWRS